VSSNIVESITVRLNGLKLEVAYFISTVKRSTLLPFWSVYHNKWKFCHFKLK